MKFVGYTTDFEGQVKIEPQLDPIIKDFLDKLSKTRRMSRNLPQEIFGFEGEFYVDGNGFMGQTDDSTVIDHNTPPHTQPGLWCQWVIEDNCIVWDQGEKFYEYTRWLEYIIGRILKPNGYTCNGVIRWRGEDFNDVGTIIVKDNEVQEQSGVF